MRRGFKALAGLVIATVCARAAPSTAAPPPLGSVYVALGSSYAAGTRLPQAAVDGPAACGQGTGSYPRRVAAALGLALIDRSCGGAVTADMLSGGQFGLPAQVEAVTGDTRLVTITGGGNDVRFVSDFALFHCRVAMSASCAEAPADYDLERSFAELETRFRALLLDVRRRAPQARVVVVDYVAIASPQGTCAALGVGVQQAEIMRTRARRLSQITAKVAAEAGADLIEASVLTADHNACSAEPWVWGAVSAEEAAAGAAAYHPRPQAHAVIASAVVARLRTAP